MLGFGTELQEWAIVRRLDPKAMVGRVFPIIREKHSAIIKPVGVDLEYKGRLVSCGKCRLLTVVVILLHYGVR